MKNDSVDELLRKVALLEGLQARHRAVESALEESEARYRALVERTHDGVAIYRAVDEGSDFVVVEFNAAAERIERVKRDDVIGRSIMSCFPGVREFGLLDVLRRVWRTGRLETFPVQLYRDDRIQGWRENIVYRLPSGEVVAVYRDETERKETDEMLRRYERIVSVSQEHIALIDREYVYWAMNDAFLAAHGKRREEVIGKRVSEVHGIETFERILRERYDRCLRGEEVHYQAWFDLARLGRRLMDVVYYPYRDESGAISGLVISARDMTSTKRLEDQLYHAHKMEALGTLAGGLAHDFNNVLMGIQGYVSLLLLDPALAPALRERLRNVESYVQSGANLTKQLLGFARGGACETAPVDLNDLLRRTSSMFGRTRREIRIHLELEESLAAVEADEGQLEQVLINLFVNAAQAMPSGGDLFLETRSVDLDQNSVKPYGVAPGPFVKIAVTDTGVGMDEATRERVFEPFFTTKEKEQGTGLGLTSAYGIVRNHHGIITCYSEVGRGTTFTIFLPASAAEAAAERPVVHDVLRGSEMLLIADDELAVLEVSADMLRSLGYQAILARSGEEALDIYRSRAAEIGLVILDMVMPKMGGGETFERLREINPGVKVLLSSGYGITEQVRKILEMRCGGFIQKPFNLRDVSLKIREILDAKQPD